MLVSFYIYYYRIRVKIYKIIFKFNDLLQFKVKNLQLYFKFTLFLIKFQKVFKNILK